MEYVAGPNLAQKLGGGPLEAQPAAHLVEVLARAMEAVHRCHVLHRDLKPANVLLASGGREPPVASSTGGSRPPLAHFLPKITDFGLAKLAKDPTAAERKLTQTGQVMGTPCYMAPEQARGETRTLGPATDVYALGAILYEALTGRTPFEGTTPADTVSRVLNEEPVAPTLVQPKLPRDLVTICLKCLEKDPPKRYASAGELADDLRRLRTGEPIRARPISRAERVYRWCRRRPAVAALWGLGGAMVLALVLIALLYHARVQEELTAAEGKVKETPNASPKAGADPAADAAGSPPAVTPGPPPPAVDPSLPARLVVTQAGPKDGVPAAFRTVREALAKARPGDRVVVQDAVHVEHLVLDGRQGRKVLIEGDTASGRPVTWRAPADAKAGQPLWKLSDAAEVRLKGFVLDGEERVRDLVTLSGGCPGLTLEDLDLHGFVGGAVQLARCTGTEDQPVTLQRLRIRPAKGGEAALAFTGGPGQASRNVLIRDCRFEGPCRAAVQLAGPVTDVRLVRNRFFRVDDGLRYRQADGRYRVRMALLSNTFYDLQKGLHFEGWLAPGSQVVVKNNLFARTRKLAEVAGFTPEPAAAKPRWIWFNDEGNPARSAPPGSRYFRKTFEVPTTPASQAILDITCDQAFTAWLNGERLGQGEFWYYNKRVYAFDVARLLRPGKNVLAVQGTTRLRPGGQPGPAGLLVRLTLPAPDGPPKRVVSDKTWRASEQNPEGWQRPDFEDGSWPAARVLLPYGGKGTPAWQNLVWDSLVQRRFPLAGRQILPGGNIRDPTSAEGFPVLEAKRRQVVPLSTDPTNDAQFLRYPKDSPLSRVGPEKTPVGVPPLEK
jgi:hypothetical protein